MQGVKFPQQTTVFGKPEGWKDEDCYGLPVAQAFQYLPGGGHTDCLVSCWELEAGDLEEIQRTGKVWLKITGATMPPVSIIAFCPFPEEQKQGEGV